MIPVIQESGRPLYEQIYTGYKEAILKNQLATGQKLPSYRILARELGVARNTVLKAYEQLALEGYVTNVSRSGLYVTQMEKSRWPSNEKIAHPTQKPRTKTKKEFTPSIHLVDETHFPLRHWRKCCNLALDGLSFQYQQHEPEDPLKAPLIRYLYEYRGVRTSADRIIIGSGASVLLFWLAFIMKGTFKRIALEEPGYARARLVFSELGYKVAPIHVGKDGIDVSALAKQKNNDLVYVTPSHQYPTGVVLPVSRRIQLLNWAKQTNSYIIEDDFDCEFRYKTRLMPSLQGLDSNDRVIYLGSFSNSLMPSLRVAYLVLPENFSIDYRSLSFLTETVPYFVRSALAIFMEQGFWERHLKKMRNLYKRKYERCIDALSRIPKHMVEFDPTPAGLHTFIRVKTKLSESELIRRAADNGILVMPAAMCYHDQRNRPREPEILLEFGSIPEERIESLVGKLFEVWFPGK